MSAKEFISLCSQLVQVYDSLNSQQYADFMREKFRVYESIKDADFRKTLRRLQMHYNRGYFNRPLAEQPIFLTNDHN